MYTINYIIFNVLQVPPPRGRDSGRGVLIHLTPSYPPLPGERGTVVFCKVISFCLFEMLYNYGVLQVPPLRGRDSGRGVLIHLTPSYPPLPGERGTVVFCKVISFCLFEMLYNYGVLQVPPLRGRDSGRGVLIHLTPSYPPLPGERGTVVFCRVISL